MQPAIWKRYFKKLFPLMILLGFISTIFRESRPVEESEEDNPSVESAPTTREYLPKKPTSVTILEFARTKQTPGTMEYKHICNLTFLCAYVQYKKGINLEKFSAVIAHGHSGHIAFNNFWQNLKHKKRPRDQIWISESMESGANPSNYNGIRSKVLESGFNWTFFASPKATFRNSYFHVEKLKTEITFDLIKQQYRSFKKSKSFCWIVSNCGMLWTKRFDLATQIIQELPDKIHMWGTAADRCLGNVAGNIVDHGPFSALNASELPNPWQYRARDCKFYFSFENSNCSDYITEKFPAALNAFAVPIVNGFRHSYQEVLPGSFIHAKDFPTFTDLASHLGYLLKNESAYLEYHRWRTTYNHSGKSPVLCDICKKISETVTERNDGKGSPSIIPSLSKAYQTMQQCNQD